MKKVGTWEKKEERGGKKGRGEEGREGGGMATGKEEVKGGEREEARGK